MNPKSFVEVFSALADAKSLAVFRLLAGAGPAGLPSSKIAKGANIARFQLSYHLQALLKAGLINRGCGDRCFVYAANFDGNYELISYLTEGCCASNPRSEAAISRREYKIG